MSSPSSALITALVLVTITALALAVAVAAGVLSRLTGVPVAAAVLKAGTAFGATVALLLSIAVATGLL
jgi:hypothetical protein